MIGAGHQWVDLQSYTLPQVEAFLAASSRSKKTDMRDAIIAARAAQADGKDLKKILKELD